MVYNMLDRAVEFFQEPRNRERIQQNCLDPMLRYLLDRMFPYIILTCILFSLILLMSLTSVGLLMFQLHMSSRIPISVVAQSANAVAQSANAVAQGANVVAQTADAIANAAIEQVLIHSP
jgi:hypothetical protein